MHEPVSASSLQIVDRWIGVPLCLFFTGVRKISDLLEPKKSTEPPRKLLFVKFAEQGSTVLAQGAIRAAVEMVGRENVYFVVFRENRFILDILGLVPEENVITIRRDTSADLIKESWAALRQIWALKIDTAIDMEFFSRSSAVLTYLTGATRRVGFHTFFGDGPYRGDLMTHRLLYNPFFHTSQIFKSLVKGALQDPEQLPTYGVQPDPVDRSPVAFQTREGEADEVRAIVRGLNGGSDPGPIILVNPNASDLLPLRKWDTARYVEVARQLLERFPQATVAMTGAPNEAEPIAAAARQVGSSRCISVAGKTTLRQLMVLYTLSELLITNDSGPAHFAALTQIHVITLFGPETPALFGAPTPRSVPIYLGLACSPCVNAYNNRQSACRNNLCMQGISVERVVSEAVKVLELRGLEQGANRAAVAGAI